MEARWLKRKNDEGVEERFYPVTHVDSVVGYESPDSVNEALEEHINNKSNPHEVTAEQVGAVHVSKVFSNTDLDTLKKDGHYFVSGDKPSENAYHIPTEYYNSINTYFELELIVFAIGSRCCQLAMATYNGSQSMVGHMWYRVGYGSNLDNITWNDWKKVADAESFLPLTGGTLSGSVFVNGGTGELTSWDNGVAVDARKNGKIARMQVQFEDVDNKATALVSHYNGSEWAAHRLYNEGDKETLRNDIYTASTTDIGAGAALETGKLYLVYE